MLYNFEKLQKGYDMQTITLKIDESVADKFMWFLSHFKKDEIEVVDGEFLKTKAYLRQQLDLIDSGKAKMVSIEEFDEKMEKVLSEYENRA